mmetsp:Transcript_9919/g.24456  ORF Transcript_9919/g.24456 Transcript_9919/m.24456 type:complete len:432 (+) Transcript_9919:264-1559(+)
MLIAVHDILVTHLPAAEGSTLRSFIPDLSDTNLRSSLTFLKSKSGNSSSMARLPRRRRNSMAALANTAFANRSAGRFLMALARIVVRTFFQFIVAMVGTATGAVGGTAPASGVKYATMHVTSSERVSSVAQCWYATATISSHAADGSPQCFSAMASTSSFSMNSNTPSEAMMRQRTDVSSWYVSISGSGDTPSFLPMVSPSDRVNAHPGKLSPLRNTRGGSSAASMVSSPKSSLMATSPRIMPSVANITGSAASLRMRSRSSARKHVWSCVTSTTAHTSSLAEDPPAFLPSSSSRVSATPRMARLSPTLPRCSMSPMMCATTAVVPLDRDTSPSSRTTVSLLSTNAFPNAVTAGSVGTAADRSPCTSSLFRTRSFRSASSFLGKMVLAICAHASPPPPWPSNTPSSSCVSSPPKLGSNTKQSWFTWPFLSG